MPIESEREYASQADYAEWVREATQSRLVDVTTSLLEAFKDVIRKEEVEVIVFSDVSAKQLS